MSAAVDTMTMKSTLRNSESMARHTSWRVGGVADRFFEPRSVEDLREFLETLPESTPVTWIGLGSNLLVRDGGIRGIVVSSSALPKVFEADAQGRVRCSAALPCATLAKRAARAGLGPAAFFAGIPGSLGGALAMNAGAFGGETWDSVVSIETIDHCGVVRTRRKAEYRVGYRSVQGPGQEWFLAATFAFSREQDAEPDRIRALLRERTEKQPLGLPSAGSVFRNPEGGHAGELIERVGLKGTRCGGAIVSEKHANFIINDGSATAADIEALIDQIRSRVRDETGVELEPEVRVIGEAGEA